MFKIGKKTTLYNGALEGTATSFIFGRCFVFKPKTNIEGIPEEFVVSHIKLWTTYNGIANIDKKLASTYIRPGDQIFIDGQIIEEFLEKDQLPIIRMSARIIYNKTLKCGFK